MSRGLQNFHPEIDGINSEWRLRRQYLENPIYLYLKLLMGVYCWTNLVLKMEKLIIYLLWMYEYMYAVK